MLDKYILELFAVPIYPIEVVVVVVVVVEVLSEVFQVLTYPPTHCTVDEYIREVFNKRH